MAKQFKAPSGVIRYELQLEKALERRNLYRAEVKRLAAKLQNLSSYHANPGAYSEPELYHEVEKLKRRLREVTKERDALKSALASREDEAPPLR